ncbi:MAPEG family protein [Nioella nitratireducens]|uniref:MAPEG family protein n=1 Tax=Nioella nitratireducens TaxID=1287720 RepID=UPI0008FD2172|nr:MAPEG family protein [Nioella nitratireducens]
MISAVYAGLLALLFLGLSAKVIRHRKARKLSHGDGNDDQMSRAIRVQANFTEYVPFALILLTLADLQGAPGWLLHAMGIVLLGGRILHAIGMGSTPQIFRARAAGMILTMLSLLVLAIANIGYGLA